MRKFLKIYVSFGKEKLEEENFFCSGKFAFRTCSDIIAEKEGGGGGGGKYIMGITHFCLLFPLRERKTLREKQIREGKGEMKGGGGFYSSYNPFSEHELQEVRSRERRQRRRRPTFPWRRRRRRRGGGGGRGGE
jgi:hypothetical protein